METRPRAATGLVFAVILAGSLVLSWVPITQAQSAREKMTWVSASNPMALCNDFTQAGFFIRRNNNSNNWVVFLESGGLCYNAESCNRRFFVKAVREMEGIRDDHQPEVIPYGRFHPSDAWNQTVYSGTRAPSETISPLMTSLQCLHVNEIEGRDILDTDPTENPLYHDYNHVIIPYCSSDVWLGEETDTTDAVRPDVSECDCFNYTTRTNPSGCFTFNATSSNLQFTFRGKIIYQSIIQQLLTDHGMMNAYRVLLAGSSTGGLGVINHAKWTRGIIDTKTDLRVLFDSSWFIDFEDGLHITLNGESTNRYSSNAGDLVEVLMSNEACHDTSQLGYPCCISAHCVLTQRNSSGQLQYYPDDTPTFALFSLYDIYLLSSVLATVPNLETVTEMANTVDNVDGVDVVFDFSAVAGEYGGIMNYTLDVATSQVSFLSYYVTQCFQHIYLATSTLWGEEGQSVFGSNSLEFTGAISTFSHTISSGRWNTLLLAANSTDRSDRGTILEALTTWMSLAGSGTIGYRDTCQGFLCNPQCPDEFILGELTSNNWHVGIKILIAILVVGLSAVCISMKVAFMCWLSYLERKQDAYLDSLSLEEIEDTGIRSEFPVHSFEEAISVACLNLHYSVKLKARKALKDEKNDQTAPIVLSNITDQDSDSEPESPKKMKKAFGAHAIKEILKGISLYFNPGELVGIMGPSGCGKTTFLDVLTARRKSGTLKGEIYVNGIPIEKNRDWYVANTGYVLQLAAPYYEELTVRENLTLAAQMKLPKTFTLREKFERVEQVIEMTGLLKLADTLVRGATGPGLSGGQKRRLVIALQLLKLPSVVFLNEPTSGLDATASFELLTHLNKLADSNRTVILTIHQPRLEIFHMFHRLVLLSDGKIAYHGAPEKAYEVFVNALTSKYLERGLIIPSLEDHNPADVIMDMLGNSKMRQIITEYYQNSNEPKLVETAIKRARWMGLNDRSLDALGRHEFKVTGPREYHGSNLTRIATLEARASKRANLGVLVFLPFMFFIFAFMLGTTYIQLDESLLVVAGVCVFSTASALFMFPAMYFYYQPALRVYGFEKADGVGRAQDIVIQGFIRFQSIAFVPVVFSTSVLYLLLVNARSYDPLVYLQVLLTNVALNQTWIALLIALVCGFPAKAFRLSPIIAALAGFTSGFFIPIGALHWGYRWVVYINPNYFALSSVAFFVLSNFQTSCEGNQLECYVTSGPYILRQFFFDSINPYLHIVVLLGFTIFFMLLAVFANWVRHTSIPSKLWFYFNKKSREKSLMRELEVNRAEYESTFDFEEESRYEVESEGYQQQYEGEEEVEENKSYKFKEAVIRVMALLKERNKAAWLQPDLDLHETDSHQVSTGKQHQRFADVMETVMKLNLKSQAPTEPTHSIPTTSIRSRQKALFSRVQATQAVLKERLNEVLNEEEEVDEVRKPKISFKEAGWLIVANLRKAREREREHLHMADVVLQYVTKMRTLEEH